MVEMGFDTPQDVLAVFIDVFEVKLSNYISSDGKSYADDVAVDAEGNAYVTDAQGGKLWKVGVDGKFLSIIKNPLFTPKEWYKNLVGLNGIVYHPDGYLIVIHTFSGNLFKIDLASGEEVKLVKVVGGPLKLGDGLELVSPTKLVVAGTTARSVARLVESSDGWETASVAATFSGPKHRLATSATVKDGKVYLSHLLGMGYPKKKHVIVEAIESSIIANNLFDVMSDMQALDKVDSGPDDDTQLRGNRSIGQLRFGGTPLTRGAWRRKGSTL
ncbi:hypothetical protein CMV_025182 [Castanea mollissima]|uniref:Uncharacterized protein n=1 Tax=Castanea mollissima TaxID=60419 RepID=A0A8J4Q9Q0_9ROSI|nr:hypothetical protein CMV_025182 [Castanea mollissima]